MTTVTSEGKATRARAVTGVLSTFNAAGVLGLADVHAAEALVRICGARAAWVVGLAAVFVLGRATAPTLGGDSRGASEGPDPAALRAIRMVFVPDQATTEQVSVAGTFNGWDATVTQMERRGDAFVTQLVLPPGSYEYMFVLDGETWVTDPLAGQTRDDGFGRENAVLDVSL